MVQSAKKITDFYIEKKLGEGSFSEVYRVKRKSDGAIYAMKKVKMGKLSAKEKENALNEVRILASVNHPNVIGYKEAFFEDSTNCLCLVMENADGGDLLMLINNHKKGNTNFTEKQVWHFFIQIIRGLKALHDLKICHRDIKCANVFLTKDGVVKLGDMNVSRINKGGMMRTQTGTPYYACPEVWKDMPYDNRSDIWSAGCVLYEMIMKMPPFRAQTMKGLYAKVLSGKYDPLPQHYTDDMRKVLRSCLQVRSSERPKCDKILAMPGLLNHLTGTLDEIQAMMTEPESLMKTIRMPRRMGEITERLPAPQYDGPTFKRTNSQPQMKLDAIDGDAYKKAQQSQMQSAAKSRPIAPGAGVRKSSNTDVSQTPKQQTSSLQIGRQVVEVESKSLIQKAHELYNVSRSAEKSKNTGALLSKTPEKPQQPMSLADRAARIKNEMDHELPAIEETYDKENDTFAQGGPIAALQIAGKRRELARQKRESASQASSRIHSRDRSHLRSAEPTSSAKKDQYRLYREPNDRESQHSGIGNLARNALPPRNIRQSYQPKGVGEAYTPAMMPSKASDLVSHLKDRVSLPRIQSSRSNQVSKVSMPSIISRQQSRQKMLEIQNRNNNNDFSTQASVHSKRNHKYGAQPLAERRSNIGTEVHSQAVSPDVLSNRSKPGSRARSIQRNPSQEFSAISVMAPSYAAGGKRADQSALDHIRRIRRNLPSQQNSRMSRDLSYDYLSAVPIGQPSTNNSKIENYKRIKQEEAMARAQLMAPQSRQIDSMSQQKSRISELNAVNSHRRDHSLLGQKYRPSENALAQYSPLRNQYSQQQLPQFVPAVGDGLHKVGVISSQELRGLRHII